MPEMFNKPGRVGFVDGNCVVCGKPSLRPAMGDIDIARGEDNLEPIVCSKCLVDMRGDMATELEVRRQLGTLEARVEGLNSKVESSLNTRLWVLGIFLAVALSVGSFFAGAYLTSSSETTSPPPQPSQTNAQG